MKRDELGECIAALISEKERLISICESGCNDPAYPDGTNMNLVRNHMIYYKGKIFDICKEKEIELPEEYYISIPPVVNDWYMAHMKQKDRVQRLIAYGDKLMRKKPSYDENQLSLF